MKNRIILGILSLFVISLIACQQAAKTETKMAPAPTATTAPSAGTTGDAAVDTVGKDLTNVDTAEKDLSTDDIGNLDSDLSDVQNI